MPFEMPWAKRKRMQVESREGCEGAVEYGRKLKLILDEFLRITGDVTKRGVFRQRDYSYVLGLLQEQQKLLPPPTAMDLHAAMLKLLLTTRANIRTLDSSGNQDPVEINQIFDEAEQILVQSVVEPWERFNAACFPGDATSPRAPRQNQTASKRLISNDPPGATSMLPDEIDPTSVDRARLAQYLRHRGITTISQSLQDMESLSAYLDRLAASPHAWLTLDQEWISLLAFHQIVTRGASEEPEQARALLNLYEHVMSKLGTRSRLALEGEIAQQLSGTGTDYLSLVPFMALDPAPAVVSTAAMDMATMMPLKNGDPLTGPAAVVEEAMEWIESDESRAAAMIAGVLMLGDARVIPMVAGCWRRLGQTGKNILMEQQSGFVSAAGIEFFLQWLESVDEDDFGHPAGALGRLAAGMLSRRGVRDLQRKFPAPFNLSDDEFRADPPIRVLQEWSQEELARAIEPRLRMAYMRETYDKVMPRVLLAWGLDVGEDDPADQIRRTNQSLDWAKSQLAQIDSIGVVGDDRPWEARARSTVASIFRALPVETALPQAMDEIARLRQEADDRRSRANDHKGSSMFGRLKQAGLHFDLEADAVMQHLQHYFGLEPRATLRIMAVMRRAADLYESDSEAEDDKSQPELSQFGLQEYGDALSAALETLGAAADERNQAIHLMKHPTSLQEVLRAARDAAAAPAKVDESLAVFVTTMPPEDYFPLHEAFMFAMTELLRQWRAELAAYGANVAHNEVDAAARTSEAHRAEAAFSRWWSMFRGALQAAERDHPGLLDSILTPLARGVVAREDLNRPSES
jgi:hypothetical protein